MNTVLQMFQGIIFNEMDRIKSDRKCFPDFERLESYRILFEKSIDYYFSTSE